MSNEQQSLPAKKSKSEWSMERRKRIIATSEIHITGTWIITNNAARAVLERIERMAKKNVCYGKEAAIQSILNEHYSREHGLI